jgi:hypothetical protein
VPEVTVKIGYGGVSTGPVSSIAATWWSPADAGDGQANENVKEPFG